MTDLVTLGTAKVPVYQQSWQRLRRLIPRELTSEEFDKLQQAAGDGADQDASNVLASQLAVIDQKVYRLLVLLVPNLAQEIPEYRWYGYQSREAMDAGGEPDEDIERDLPGLDDIVLAFDKALEVNGFKRLFELLQLVRDGRGLLPGGGGGPPANGRPPTPTSST